MKGINYLTDQKGERTAVVFDLKKYREELEDFIDGLEAASRLNEPRVDFKKAVNKIIKSKSRNGLSSHHKKVR
jgi:hypothetical protein